MTNLLDRIPPLKGTAADGLIHNWLGKPVYELPGIPLGVTVDENNAPAALDPSLLKKILENLEVKDIGIIAEQGAGKTFLATLWLLIMMALEGKQGRYMRCRYNSRKRNNDMRPEAAPFVEDIMKCKIIQPHQMRLNPLSRLWDMTFDEQYTMVKRIYQYTMKRQLTLEEQTVLKSCLRTVMADKSVEPSFPALEKAFSDLDPFMAMTADTASGESSLLQQQQVRNHTRLADAAFQLKLATELFNEGEYASLFAGTGEEMLELLTQRAVSFDVKDMTTEMRSVVEIILAAITAAASTPWPDDPEKKPRHPEWKVEVILTDEAYADWENPEFVESEYERMKTQRATGIIGVMIFHRLRDFLEAISHHATGHKARNAVNEIKIWLIGRQNASELNSIRSFFSGLPEYVVQDLPTMLKGHFWLVLPAPHPPVKIAVIGSRLAIEAFATDAANDDLLQAYFREDKVKYYLDWLEKTTPWETAIDNNGQGGIYNEETEASTLTSV